MIAAKSVSASITRAGGHVGPVAFTNGRKRIVPMAVAPWHNEMLPKDTPPIIRVLRGDFFCMPFGGNTTAFGKERHPVHGEVANSDWALVDETQTKSESSLRLQLQTRVRKASVDKVVRLVPDHHAVYHRHTIRGASGPMPLGHHAVVRFPDAGGMLSTSPFNVGQVFPEPIERPENRGYSILMPGARFDSLSSVPMITGQCTDLSKYPARRGFEDLVMIVSDPSVRLGWTAAAFPTLGYVWFGLKDVKVLRNTVFWFSNGGRHYAPWNGRHINVLGMEETTSYFHSGLAESSNSNPISDAGMRTVIELSVNKPTTVNYIFGIAPIPPSFGSVESIEPTGSGIVISDDLTRVKVSLDVDFLFGVDMQ